MLGQDDPSAIRAIRRRVRMTLEETTREETKPAFVIANALILRCEAQRSLEGWAARTGATHTG